MLNISSRAYRTLSLIRRLFSAGHTPQTKRLLYLSLVHSQLTYCSQIWHPHLLKDILALEQIQHHTTKYILNDYSSDYRSRLIHLNILLLMMQLELYDIMFFVRCLKEPTDAFNIYDHVTFCTSSTRSSPLISSCSTLCPEQTLQDISTAIEFLDYGTLYLPLTWISLLPLSSERFGSFCGTTS